MENIVSSDNETPIGTPDLPHPQKPSNLDMSTILDKLSLLMQDSLYDDLQTQPAKVNLTSYCQDPLCNKNLKLH